MNLKKKIIGAGLSLSLITAAMFSFAGAANATGESATIGLRMDPLQGGLSKKAFKPVNWQVDTKISPAAGSPTIDPLKEANIDNPRGSLSFNPDPKMPVCSNKKVNPQTVSVPVETIIKACPKSIIGNGTATFALGQATSISRDGVMIVFNGGKQKTGPLKGQPRIMVYAYSYDTEVGVYTEAALAKDGSLDFKVPVLTADSSVTSLNLAIPGKPTTVEFPMKGITAKLPAGQDKSYAQAKCATGTWRFGAEFLLGDRPEGAPAGPTTKLNESGTQSCTGSGSGGGGGGKAKLAAPKIKGPARAKAGRTAIYKVTVKNAGRTAIRAVKVVASGKGARGAVRVGTLARGKSKTVKVKVKFTKKGKIKTRFKVTGKGAGAKVRAKVVTVR